MYKTSTVDGKPRTVNEPTLMVDVLSQSIIYLCQTECEMQYAHIIYSEIPHTNLTNSQRSTSPRLNRANAISEQKRHRILRQFLSREPIDTTNQLPSRLSTRHTRYPRDELVRAKHAWEVPVRRKSTKINHQLNSAKDKMIHGHVICIHAYKL